MPETRWAVGQVERVLAPAVILDALFATISYRLEPDGLSTRFPLTMTQLRFGRLDPAKSGEAAVELDAIARELKAMPIQRVVRDIANPQPVNAATMPVNRQASNVYDYFITSERCPVLSVVRDLVEQSRRQRKPIRVVSRQQPPTVPARKVLPVIVGAAIVAAVAYRWYPHYVLTFEGGHDGPRIWVVGAIVFILGCAFFLLDHGSELVSLMERIKQPHKVAGAVGGQTSSLMASINAPQVPPRASRPQQQVHLDFSGMHEYLRGRGLVQRLDGDEVEFAVIQLRMPTDEKSIRSLGEELREWARGNSGVSIILGLEPMLQGKCPEVATCLLGIPMVIGGSNSDSWITQVALVVVKRNAPEAKLAASLSKLVESSGVAFVWSYEQYGHMTR